MTKRQAAYHARLIKRFHTLLNQLPDARAAKEEILLSYDVCSSKYLSIEQLSGVCYELDRVLKPANAELDKWRKRLIASIGGWLRAMNKSENIDMIKAIACRAAVKQEFTQIPMEQLRSLYSAFTKKQKDLKSVEMLTEVEIGWLEMLN